MTMNRIQFQKGLFFPGFQSLYGMEKQCEAALEKARWLDGYRCSRCQNSVLYVLHVRSRKTFMCEICSQQTSLISGTLFPSTKLPLTNWLLTIYLVSQSENNLSTLSLKRQLRKCYRSAWRIKHKLMEASARREEQNTMESQKRPRKDFHPPPNGYCLGQNRCTIKGSQCSNGFPPTLSKRRL